MRPSNFERITQRKKWRSYADVVLNELEPAVAPSEAFSSYWIVAGHHIREQIGDDRVLIRLLRRLLPAYHGPGLTLFRGENRDRWTAGSVGVNWTSEVEIARMFARGLNAVRSGGVLLSASFESAAIISEPNSHSKRLGEEQFTVDPLGATGLLVLDVFPPA